jgi:hypothetical protein
MTNLRLIVSNDRPNREEKHPRNWLLYKDKHVLEVHVTYDSHKPHQFSIQKGFSK